MKKNLYLLSVLFCNSIYAQEVSNIVAFQESGKAVIKYDLLSMDVNKEFLVKIFSSMDGGKTYGGALTQISGDANKLVKSGPNRMAVWDILKEAPSAKGEFTFRIDALSVGANGALPTINEKDISVQFLDLSKTGTNGNITFVVTNKSQNPFTLILANIQVVDDQDKIVRDIAGDVGRAYAIPPGEKRTANLIMNGISPNAKGLSQLDFNAGFLSIHLKNLSFTTN